MRIANDDDNDNDNGSSNVNETIKTFYFFMKRFHTHKKHNKKHKKHVKGIKTHISKQKQKRQHFYVLKKHLKGKKVAYLLICFFALFYVFCAFVCV